METAQLDPQAQALLEQMNLMQAQAAAPTHVLSPAEALGCRS